MLALAILLQIFASVLSCGKFRQRIQERRLLEDEREGTTRLVIISDSHGKIWESIEEMRNFLKGH